MSRPLTIMLALVLVPCLVSTSSGAIDLMYPIVTTDITVAESIKIYTYHVTIPAGSGYDLTVFELYMPEAGARSVISFISSSPGWSSEGYFDGNNPYGDASCWVIYGGGIWEGETRDFILTTPVDVPTSYDYVVQQSDTNWGWSTTHAAYGSHSSLPVPVPEPSSLLALLCGIGGMKLRRRK